MAPPAPPLPAQTAGAAAPAPATPSGPTVDRIRQRGTLLVGMDAGEPDWTALFPAPVVERCRLDVVHHVRGQRPREDVGDLDQVGVAELGLDLALGEETLAHVRSGCKLVLSTLTASRLRSAMWRARYWSA